MNVRPSWRRPPRVVLGCGSAVRLQPMHLPLHAMATSACFQQSFAFEVACFTQYCPCLCDAPPALGRRVDCLRTHPTADCALARLTRSQCASELAQITWAIFNTSLYACTPHSLAGLSIMRRARPSRALRPLRPCLRVSLAAVALLLLARAGQALQTRAAAPSPAAQQRAPPAAAPPKAAKGQSLVDCLRAIPGQPELRLPGSPSERGRRP